MANPEHLKILKRGTATWNEWREQHPETQPDLSDANLSDADLRNANLSGANLGNAFLREATLSRANLSDANLSGAYLHRANLSGAYLHRANLSRASLSDAYLGNAFLREATLNNADLSRTNLSGANLGNAFLREATLNNANLSNTDLRNANLSGANLGNAILIEAYLYRATLSNADLTEANLRLANLIDANVTDADLSRADLSFATFVRTNLKGTTLTECRIYGISAWDVELTGALQNSLVITPPDEPEITVDNIKIAQFIYLLLNNKEIRDVINTLTTKSVLILGRFTPERKAVLDALREALRQHNYLPILFDFEPANTQTVRETVRTLAHLSHFIIADLTNPSSIPEEIETIVPTLAVPIQPLLETTQKREFSMFKGYGVYEWVLPIYRYADLTGLLDNVQEKVIEPATQKARELEAKKVRLNQEPFEQTT